MQPALAPHTSRARRVTPSMFRHPMAMANVIATVASRDTRRIAVGVLACLLAGCATTRALMPTPVLDLLFLTDRAPADGTGDPPYTAERSRSIAFGSDQD